MSRPAGELRPQSLPSGPAGATPLHPTRGPTGGPTGGEAPPKKIVLGTRMYTKDDAARGGEEIK